MNELRADMELKDTPVVAVLKIEGEGPVQSNKMTKKEPIKQKVTKANDDVIFHTKLNSFEALSTMVDVEECEGNKTSNTQEAMQVEDNGQKENIGVYLVLARVISLVTKIRSILISSSMHSSVMEEQVKKSNSEIEDIDSDMAQFMASLSNRVGGGANDSSLLEDEDYGIYDGFFASLVHRNIGVGHMVDCIKLNDGMDDTSGWTALDGRRQMNGSGWEAKMGGTGWTTYMDGRHIWMDDTGWTTPDGRHVRMTGASEQRLDRRHIWMDDTSGGRARPDKDWMKGTALTSSKLPCSGYGWMAREGRHGQPDEIMLQQTRRRKLKILVLYNIVFSLQVYFNYKGAFGSQNVFEGIAIFEKNCNLKSRLSEFAEVYLEFVWSFLCIMINILSVYLEYEYVALAVAQLEIVVTP
nr:hypothetical protein [Tanacetum cinerariifolium]